MWLARWWPHGQRRQLKNFKLQLEANISEIIKIIRHQFFQEAARNCQNFSFDICSLCQSLRLVKTNLSFQVTPQRRPFWRTSRTRAILLVDPADKNVWRLGNVLAIKCHPRARLIGENDAVRLT